MTGPGEGASSLGYLPIWLKAAVRGSTPHFHLYASEIGEATRVVSESADGILVAHRGKNWHQQVELICQLAKLKRYPVSLVGCEALAARLELFEVVCDEDWPCDPMLPLKALGKAILVPLHVANSKPWWKFW
jgi:hypothetical protein